MSVSLKRLLLYFKPHKGDFSLAASAMALDAGLSSASIWILKVVIDQIFINKDMDMLYDLVWVLPTLFLFKGIFSFTLNYRITKIGHAVARSIRGALMRKLLALDHGYYSLNKTSDLLARSTNDVTAVANMTSNAPLYIIRDGLTVIFLLGTVLYLNFRFALIIFFTIPLFAVIFAVFIRKLRKITKKAQELISSLYGTIGEAMQGLATIKIFLYEDKWLKKFETQNEDHYRAMLKFQKITALSPALMEFLSVLVLTAVLFWGGLEVIRGTWSAGDFMAFLGAAFAVYMPIKHLSQVNPIVQLGTISWGRICEVIDTPLVHSPAGPGIPSNGTAQKFQEFSFKQEITFEKVGLTYPDGRTGIHEVSLTIRKGEKVGLAGPSGSGKTSLAMLLARFYEPTKGRVLLDGGDIKLRPIQDLRSLIAFVTQEAFLFDDTLAANIAVGRPGASMEEIEKAARMAHASEFIERLPLGYRTPAGERGVRLSGGQKQRIAIARAILKNPQILILDEATSNLDPESEELVLDAVRHLLEGKTALIISHRFQTLEHANRIFVMEAGRIVEESAPGKLAGGESRLERLMGL